MKITANKISNENMLPVNMILADRSLKDFYEKKVETATISIPSLLQNILHDDSVKCITPHIDDDVSFVLQKTPHYDSSGAIKSFRTSIDGKCEYVFSCSVTHINKEKQEVEAQIYFKWPAK